MIKTGVIGVGHMGHHHTRILSELPDSELIGVCDIDENRGREVAKNHNCPFFRDRKDLLDLTDAVIIATPTSTHRDISLDALKRGNHILVEKPISLDLKEADEIISTAYKKNLLLKVGYVERFNPAILAARGKVEKPLFIEAHRLSPFYGRGADVSVVLDLMVHDIDIILQCIKSPIEHLSACGIPVLTDNIDIANARLEFENGSIANLTASRISLGKLRKIRFWQKYSYISVDSLNKKVIVYHRVINDGAPEIIEEEVEVPGEEPLRLEIQSFLDACSKNEKIEIKPEETRAAFILAHKILDKIESRANKVNINLAHEENP
ncbi:Gfo/Idh/MocA family oxidoreductase [candidate division WOR-3 bacterium]|nr:Gfo/Idh/MocA family oxidoreductase [candidate division WOR-3 bacterium]